MLKVEGVCLLLVINEPKEVIISLDVFLEVFGIPLTKMQTVLLICSGAIAATVVTYVATKRRKQKLIV